MKTKLDIVPSHEWLGSKKPILIAGPCSAETESQVMSTAEGIAKNFPDAIYRAGIWKPRTRPNTFEGVGVEGLRWLQEVKKTTGMRIATEVASSHHVEECLKHGVDIIWIGARTTVNPFSVQQIADSLRGVDIPVLVKNPIHPDIQLWIGALERLNNVGLTKLAAIHRGFHSYASGPFRNTPGWDLAIELKTLLPGIAIINDPSHICGNTDLIPYVSQKALDMDMDGLMIETHICPKVALSDAKQQVTPDELNAIVRNFTIRKSVSDSPEFINKLDVLRKSIDEVDENLLSILFERMNLSKKIGELKKNNDVTILQKNRWEEVLKIRTETGVAMGIEGDFTRKLYSLIHDESIRIQEGMMNNIPA